MFDQPVMKWLLNLIWGQSIGVSLANSPLIAGIVAAFACVIICMTISFVFKFILELIK